MNEHKIPRSPLRVAILTFVAVILIGLVAGLVAIVFVNPGGDMEKRGELLGNGLAKLGTIAALIAYFVQRHRTSGGQR